MTDAGFWSGAAAGGVSVFGGLVTAWLSTRGSREARFEKRIFERLHELEEKVVQCERERPQMLIVTMGLRMVVLELQRLDGRNPVLQQVALALSALPVENESFSDLIAQIDALTPDYRPPTKGQRS